MSSKPKLAVAPDVPPLHRRLGNRLLRRLGLRLTSANRRLNLADAAVHLGKRGIKPRTVIDVGVAWGTDDLYEAFPDAHLLLVEPNTDWKNHIDAVLSRRRGDVAYCAAGQENSSVTLHIWRGAEGSSSIHPSGVPSPSEAKIEQATVPLRRLDDLCLEHQCEGPFVVKIDVQGAEIDVLNGMSGILDRTDAIIVETSLFGGQNGCEVGDLIRLMGENGWKPYDFVGFNYRPRDRAVAQIDVVFVPDHGIARDSHAWA